MAVCRRSSGWFRCDAGCGDLSSTFSYRQTLSFCSKWKAIICQDASPVCLGNLRVCRCVALGAIDAWGKHIFWENAALWIIAATEDYIWIRFVSVKWIHLLQKTLTTSKGCMFVSWYYFPPDAILAAAGASRWFGHGNGGPLSTLLYIHVNNLLFIHLYTMCGRQKNRWQPVYIYSSNVDWCKQTWPELKHHYCIFVWTGSRQVRDGYPLSNSMWAPSSLHGFIESANWIKVL